jgi:ribonuclease PH
MRSDGRKPDEVRPVKINTGFIDSPAGAALFEMGRTRIMCAASVQERLPPWLHRAQMNGESRGGWLTAEYSILPGATTERTNREASMGRQNGRTMEIQRMIGRALRAVVSLEGLGQRTLWIDCDVLQADGGTRTASITGGFVALMKAFNSLQKQRLLDKIPIKEYVAAVSVGVVGNEVLLDLDAREDKVAQVDFNIVMTESGKLVEIQGAAERQSFTRQQLDKMLDAAGKGIAELIRVQKQALKQ